MSDLSDAHLVADEALRLKAEVERLRGLIRAAVDGQKWGQCPCCLAEIIGRAIPPDKDPHDPGCKWIALMDEAEKP